jgi:ABC-type transporter Mla subunit MlaD
MTYQNRILLRQNLSESVQLVRREALSSLVSELMQILTEQGYHLSDLIEAVADLCDEKPNLSEATRLLEQAAEQVSCVREQLNR